MMSGPILKVRVWLRERARSKDQLKQQQVELQLVKAISKKPAFEPVSLKPAFDQSGKTLIFNESLVDSNSLESGNHNMKIVDLTNQIN